MTKRVIAMIMAIMLCVTLIACSNQAPTQTNIEESKIVTSDTTSVTSSKEEANISDDTTAVHSQKPTVNSTPSSTTASDIKTTEKENVETKTSENSVTEKEAEISAPPKEVEKPKTTEEKKTETTLPPVTKEEPQKNEPVTPPSTTEIEKYVAQYVNQYRSEQGNSKTTVLTGLTEVARFRAKQLVTNFSHNSIPNACNELKYGEFVDMTLYGGTESDSYYQGYNREAFGKGDWFGTAEQIAKRIAKGFKNSSGHWSYVGDSQYGYMAVGVYYNQSEEKWYCCICMSSKNYGD